MKIAIILFILLAIGFGCMLWNNAPKPHFLYEVKQSVPIEPIVAGQSIAISDNTSYIKSSKNIVKNKKSREETDKVYVCSNFRKTKFVKGFVKECDWVAINE